MNTKLLALSFFILTSCGGGGGGNNAVGEVPDDQDNIVESGREQGIFKDSTVSGLSYRCGDYIGVTDDNGGFSCDNGEYVTFSVGNVILGSTVFSKILSPIDLVEDGSSRNISVQNISRFLQMLDIDGDPSNGISISQDVSEIAAYWNNIDFSADLNIDGYISDVSSVDNTTHILPSGIEASEHLEESLNITPDIMPGCSIVFSGYPFCDAGEYPTCDTSGISASDVEIGMSYSQVVNIFGCHGVLVNVTEGSTVTIAQYTWGSSTSHDWFIVFKEEEGVSLLYSFNRR